MKLSTEQLGAVLRQYGHSFSRVDFVQNGYRNTSHIVETTTGLLCNVIVYKREDGIVERIRRVNALSRHLRDAGLPVRTPLDERILQLRSGVFSHYGCLYSFERGVTISWEAYAMKHIKLLGMAMGRIHSVAESFQGELPRVTDEYEAIIGRMRRYFADPNVARAVRDKLGLTFHFPFDELVELLNAADLLPNQQALHMDFVRGNVLFRPAEESDTLVVDGVALSGILDLEKAAYGHPVFDLARTLAFLLVDCNKPAGKVYKYFLYSGYVKRGGRGMEILAEDSTRALRSGSLGAGGQIVLPRFVGKTRHSQAARVESSAMCILEGLTTLFLVYDFYKFLRQNPYESLAENRHFVRTRDILVQRKVIQ